MIGSGFLGPLLLLDVATFILPFPYKAFKGSGDGDYDLNKISTD